MVRGEITHVSSLNKPTPCCLNTCNQILLIDLNRILLSLVNWSSKGSHNVNVVTPSMGTSNQSKIETEL